MKEKLVILAAMALIIAVSGCIQASLGSNAITIEAKSISSSSATWFVDYSSYINLKFESGCAVPTIQGDSDISTSQSVCDYWEGGYSTSQGNCDVRKIAADSTVTANNIYFRGKKANVYVGTDGKLRICLTRSLAGCSQADIDNDVCTGRVSGTFTLQKQTQTPTEFCGDGICNNAETYNSCSQDCQAPEEPPAVELFCSDYGYLSNPVGSNCRTVVVGNKNCYDCSREIEVPENNPPAQEPPTEKKSLIDMIFEFIQSLLRSIGIGA